MELMAGGSLEARLRSADTLSVPEVTRILAPLADALDYAHGRGVLHRDVKPSNILFGEAGRPVLSDFGVARFIPSRDQSQTTHGGGYDPPGTTDFMAPEVLVEAPHSVASDITRLV
jgi:serine/threonine protein kinase